MNGTERYREIDLVRGIALVMMIIFHTLFDLNFFNIFPVDVYSGFWRFFAYATASLFLWVVGVSLTISRARAARYLDRGALVKKFALRGAGIICLGLVVTLVTWWYLGDGFVVFGILSLIGVSVMCSPLFFRFGRMNAVLGVFVIIIGIALGDILYPGGVRAFTLPRLPAKAIAPLVIMGRHSLLIYLVHQPLILAVLYVFT